MSVEEDHASAFKPDEAELAEGFDSLESVHWEGHKATTYIVIVTFFVRLFERLVQFGVFALSAPELGQTRYLGLSISTWLAVAVFGGYALGGLIACTFQRNIISDTRPWIIFGLVTWVTILPAAMFVVTDPLVKILGYLFGSLPLPLLSIILSTYIEGRACSAHYGFSMQLGGLLGSTLALVFGRLVYSWVRNPSLMPIVLNAACFPFFLASCWFYVRMPRVR